MSINHRSSKNSPGFHLRETRQRLGLSMRDVQAISQQIARKLHRAEFSIPATRIHEFERKRVVPSIHRIYTLSRVYRCEMKELLSWYGVPRR